MGVEMRVAGRGFGADEKEEVRVSKRK